QLEIHLRLVHSFALAPPARDGRLHAGVLARHRLRALGIVPEIGRRRLLAQLRGALLESVEVKDASRVSRRARRDPGRARAGPRGAWRRLTPCPAPWRRSISNRAARRERAAASLHRRSPRTYRDLGMIRGREFGSAGLAIAVLALALALLPGWVSPAPEPPPGRWGRGEASVARRRARR